MRILAIETSCDETSAAVVERKNEESNINVLSNVVATSLALHAKTGGIIPEDASREQVKFILPVIVKALLESEGIKSKNPEEDFKTANKILKDKIDSIAVTHGPGLIGSLLVGVETAKTLSFTFDKPIVPVNHLLAHIFANFIHNTKYKIQNTKPLFPFIGSIISGAHTDLLYFESVTSYKWLGGTRDDAAGEAFDKIGRLLNFPYPAGPEIERRANLWLEKTENRELIRQPADNITFHSPMVGSKDFDFSFSGLKSEVARFVEKNKLDEKTKNEVCYAVQKAIIDVLVKKTIRAVKMYKSNSILLGGGVSANTTLANKFRSEIADQNLDVELFVPERKYTTDNAAMIGTYALLNYQPVDWQKITALPELYFQ